MTTQTVRIAIVEDQIFMAKALAGWLTATAKHFEIVGHATDGNGGLKLCLETKPDLMLLDIQLPGMDGLELAQQLHDQLPKTRILFMSGMMDPYTIWRISQSRAHGYIQKTTDPTVVTEIIAIVARGGTYFSPVFYEVKNKWLSQPGAFQKVLSDREQQVLTLLASGEDDEAIAARLAIAAGTVSVHRKHIRQKLGLHNDRELMTYARQWGLDKLS
jgi:two-component system, NarL family, response regulator NreC